MSSLSRRGFFKSLGAILAGASLDPERALWIPGRKLISIPEPANLCIRYIQMFDIIVGEQAARFDVSAHPLQMPKGIELGALSGNLTMHRALEEAARFFSDQTMYRTDSTFHQTARNAIRQARGAMIDTQYGITYWIRRGKAPGYFFDGPEHYPTPYPEGAAILDVDELRNSVDVAIADRKQEQEENRAKWAAQKRAWRLRRATSRS